MSPGRAAARHGAQNGAVSDEMVPHATALADAVEEALPRWVERSVARVLSAQGVPATPEVRQAAAEAGRRAREEVGARVRALVSADVDEQRSTPLALLRDAVRYPTAVLREAGARPVDRDDYAVDRFPDDPYDLTPANFSDVDPALSDPGIAWGAAKAWTHRRRHGGPAQGATAR